MWDLEKILTLAAAGAQAVGSIIALYVAFKVASRQAERDDRRREQEQDDWRAGMLAIAVEMREFLLEASRMYDLDVSSDFIRTYDQTYPYKLIELLYGRAASDKMLPRDIAPTLRIIKYFKEAAEQISTRYNHVKSERLTAELTNTALRGAALILAEIDEMKQAPMS